MGEFHEAISTLLSFFGEGLSSIKAHSEKKSRRRSTSEARLSESLRKSRNDVKSVYDRDLEKFGEKFAKGDAEARSSIAVILSRLAAGVLSIVTRMSKDKSTASDYQTLVSLSDVTRSETIQTFDQLSSRISSSSIHLVRPSSSNQRPKASRKHSSKSSTSNSRSHTRAKSVPSLSVTPLGLATDSGWIRPKPSSKKRNSKSKSMSSMDSSKKPAAPSLEAPPSYEPLSSSFHRPSPINLKVPVKVPTSLAPRRPENVSHHRKSIMSFASDSTKLGEIPEYKWIDQQDLHGDFPVTAFFPMNQYTNVEKQKPRSRLRRLFGRG